MTTLVDTPPAPVDLKAAPPVVDEGAGLGHQLRPWIGMLCLTTAAAAARVAVHATGHEAAVATATFAVAFATAVVAALVTRRRLWTRRLRRRFVAALFLGAAWLSWVAAHGWSLPAVRVMAIVGCCLSLAYWRAHRIGYNDTPAGQPPAAEPPAPARDVYADRWDRHIGGAGRPLAGSTLTEPTEIKAGYRYVVDLVPGQHTPGQVRALLTILRGGLRLRPEQDLIAEDHPTRPAPTALLTIITRPQVTRPQMWPGPARGFDPQTGSVNLGPFADGEGTAKFSVYRQDGMFGGYIQGGIGSGKSRVIDSLAMSLACADSHPTVIWYGDGQFGSSSPLLAEHADWPALAPERVYEMLVAAVRVMQINGVENRLNRNVGFTPTARRPGLLVIIDECHAILDPRRNPLFGAACQLLALTIAREGRKAGVALLLASQAATLDAFGGAKAGNSADTLRGSLLQGNGIMLRSKSSNPKQIFKVDLDPQQFPDLPGYGLLVDPQPGARNAPFRGFWLTDDMAKTWPGRIMWLSLPRRQANAAGPAYARRHETAVEQDAADRRLLELADAGLLSDADLLSWLAEESGTTRPTSTPTEVADALPAVRFPGRFRLIRGGRQQPDLKPGSRAVLEAIAVGIDRPTPMIEATGYSSAHVYKSLNELEAAGLVVNSGGGSYRATDAGRDLLTLAA